MVSLPDTLAAHEHSNSMPRPQGREGKEWYSSQSENPNFPEDQAGNFLGPEKRRRSIHPDAVSGLMALEGQDRRKLKTIPAAIRAN